MVYQQPGLMNPVMLPLNAAGTNPPIAKFTILIQAAIAQALRVY